MSIISPQNTQVYKHHSKLSAERYSRASNDFDELDTLNPSSFRFEDLFPDMECKPAPQPRHHRRHSQPSQQSQGGSSQQYDPEYNKKRNDAVLNQILSALNSMQSGDKKVCIKSSKDFEVPMLHNRRISEVESVIMVESESTQNNLQCYKRLPELGGLPVMAFCWKCDKEVHTSVRIQGNSFTRFWGKILNCCGNMMWFEKKKVHRCPICEEIVGYSRY